MSRKKRNRSKSALIVPLVLVGVAAVSLGLSLTGKVGEPIDFDKLYHKLIFPLIRLVAYLAAGLLVGQFIESMGWTRKLARLVRPLTRWGRLKEESGAAFISSFVSGIVANTMLMDFHKQGKITRTELIITYLLDNGLPMYLVHLPTTFFIVVSLAGSAGMAYLGITFVAACLRSLSALVANRIIQPKQAYSPSIASEEPPAASKASITSGFLKRFRDRFTRVVLYTVPIYVLVFLLNHWGIFVWLRTSSAHWVATDLFPIEKAGMIVFTFAAEFSSGMAAAGAFLHSGALTVKQVSLALIAGTIVATPIRAIRHQLPTHAGIFSLGLGTQLLVLSQGFRVITLILVAAAYGIWW